MRPPEKLCAAARVAGADQGDSLARSPSMNDDARLTELEELYRISDANAEELELPFAGSLGNAFDRLCAHARAGDPAALTVGWQLIADLREPEQRALGRALAAGSEAGEARDALTRHPFLRIERGLDDIGLDEAAHVGANRISCPDCTADLQADGSCCDVCGWRIAATSPRASGRTPAEIVAEMCCRCPARPTTEADLLAVRRVLAGQLDAGAGAALSALEAFEAIAAGICVELTPSEEVVLGFARGARVTRAALATRTAPDRSYARIDVWDGRWNPASPASAVEIAMDLGRLLARDGDAAQVGRWVKTTSGAQVFVLAVGQETP